MALTFPTVNGNWSNPAIWSGSTLPTINDDVHANNKTVIIDQNVNILSLRNTASGSAVIGGTFTVSGSYTITTSGIGFVGGSTTLLTCSGSGVISLIGNIYSGIGGDITCINLIGSGTVNVAGNLYTFTGAYRSYAININTPCRLNIVGDVYYGPGGSTENYAIRTITNGGYTINITGNVYQTLSNYTVMSLNSSGSINITGNLYGVASSTVPVISIVNSDSKISIVGSIPSLFPSPTVSPITLTSTSQSVDLTGNVFASLSVPAVTVMNPTSTAILRGVNLVNSFQNPGFSRPAIVSPCLTIVPSNQFRWTFYNAPSSSLNSTMFVQGYVPDSPSQADVRFGTTYLAGALSGSVQMPQPSQVISGVKTDNTTGSYDVTVEALTEAVWTKLTSTLTGSNTIGERLKNNSTIDSTGQQLQALI